MQQNAGLVYGNHGHQMAHDRVPLLVVLICLFVLFVFVPSAFACSPALDAFGNAETVMPVPKEPTLSESIDASDLIVIGTVAKAEGDAAVINVENYLKGQGPHEIWMTGFAYQDPSTGCSLLVSASFSASNFLGTRGIFYISGNPIFGFHPGKLWMGGAAVDAVDPVIIEKIKQRTGQQLTKPSKSQPLWITGRIIMVASVCLVGIVFGYRKFKSKTR